MLSTAHTEGDLHPSVCVCLWVWERVFSSWCTSVASICIWVLHISTASEQLCSDILEKSGVRICSARSAHPFLGSGWRVTAMRNCRFESMCLPGLSIVPESICGQWRFRSGPLSFVEVSQWASSNASCHRQINWLRSVQQSLGWIKGGEKEPFIPLGGNWTLKQRKCRWNGTETVLPRHASFLWWKDSQTHRRMRIDSTLMQHPMCLLLQRRGPNQSSCTCLSFRSLIKWSWVTSWIRRPGVQPLLPAPRPSPSSTLAVRNSGCRLSRTAADW